MAINYKPPRVTGSRRQPTTGSGRIVRPPGTRQVFGPWNGRRPAAPVAAPNPAAPAAPVAPAAPAAAAPLVPPPDATYEQQVGIYRRNRDDALAGLTSQRTNTLADSGYKGTFDPAGNVTGLSFDPNNPFSKAALLKKNFDQSRTANVGRFAGQGQLYSGALQSTQDESNVNQIGAEDTQQKGLIRFLTENLASQKKAGTDFDTSVAGAEGERLGRIADNPLYSPSQDPTLTQATPNPTAVSNASATQPVTKVTRGFVWQQNSNGTWRKVRPVNAFGH